MNPILFESTAKSFNNNGIGILSDAAFCEVTEERNGIFELVLNYPISGLHYSKIKYRSIILAKPNATAKAQPFRVYKITKPINGIVTAYAQHISYDLSGNPVLPFTAGSAAAALQALKNNSVGENPFEFWTDKSTVAEMAVKTPASVRAMLGGVSGSVLDTYGGEYEWDGFTVKLYNKRGQNRGVSIRYGKNLIDLNQEENCAGVYTAVMPFWADNEGNTIILDEKTVPVEGSFDFEKVFVLDLSSEFENQPTKEELRLRTEKYIEANKIGIPHVSINLSFVQLEQTEEYKNKALLERVSLCDEVNVVFEKLGVSATAKVVKTVFDVLLNRYKTVELGDAQSTLADTLIKQDQAIKDAPKKAMSIVTQAAENATQLITGNRGGYVVIHSSTGSKEPDEILIMDKPTIEEAVKVWRWNNSGLGYSETGYSGTYTTAWTIDGAFNADFITSGTISANLIKSGLLQNIDTSSVQTSLDMNSGKMVFEYPNIRTGYTMKIEIWAGGITFYSINTATLETQHLGSFYISVDGTGVIKCDSFAISKNDNNVYVRIGRNQNEDGQIILLNRNGKNIVEIANNGSNLGGFFRANNAEQEERATLWVTSNDSGILTLKNTDNKNFAQLQHITNAGAQLDLCDENGTITAQLKNKAGAGGQLELRNESGKATFSFSNRSGGGAECWIGEGNGAYKIFDFLNDKIRVFAHQLTLYGKANLISGGGLSNSECSAYIVFGQPTNGGYVSSVIVPADIATSYSWQLADETNYIQFTMGSNGSATKVKGSSNSGGIIGVYSIR